MSQEDKSTGHDWKKRRRPDAVEWGMIIGLVFVCGGYALMRWLGIIH